MFLHRRWYRRFTTLDAFELDSGVIERKKDLTLEEFHTNYDMKKPVNLILYSFDALGLEVSSVFHLIMIIVLEFILACSVKCFYLLISFHFWVQ